MSRIILSLVLSLVFSLLIFLGVGIFQIISSFFNSNAIVLCIGFFLLYIAVYFTLNESLEELKTFEILDKDESDKEFF